MPAHSPRQFGSPAGRIPGRVRRAVPTHAAAVRTPIRSGPAS